MQRCRPLALLCLLLGLSGFPSAWAESEGDCPSEIFAQSSKPRAALVQHRSHVHHGGSKSRGRSFMSIAGRNKKRFSSLCKGEELRSHCRKSEGAYWADVRNVKPATNLELHIARDAGDEILAEMKASSPDIYNSQKDARSAFEYLRHLDARNVLAFRETWTSEDTNMLLKLDKFPNGWTQGDFSEEKFRSYLPSIKVLEEAINRGPMALVGSGPSVAGNGGMIDLHPVIVRFNNHVGNELKFHDTGRKMTMHVINGHIDFYNERDVLHLDLEGTTPGASMCKRWHQSEARKTGVPEDQLTIMFRPSAVCGIPGGLRVFRITVRCTFGQRSIVSKVTSDNLALSMKSVPTAPKMLHLHRFSDGSAFSYMRLTLLLRLLAVLS